MHKALFPHHCLLVNFGALSAAAAHPIPSIYIVQHSVVGMMGEKRAAHIPSSNACMFVLVVFFSLCKPLVPRYVTPALYHAAVLD